MRVPKGTYNRLQAVAIAHNFTIVPGKTGRYEVEFTDEEFSYAIYQLSRISHQAQGIVALIDELRAIQDASLK